MVIKKIDAFSLGKVLGAMYGAMGLLVGVIVSLISLAGSAISMGSELGDAGIFGMMMGVGAIIMLPIFYGAMGFLGGLLSAVIYNLFAKLVGGVQIEVE